MIKLWYLWGMGWLIMPRMTIGILILVITNHSNLGITLTIIGGILDLISKTN